MANYITYKTIISQAISHFNSVQNALNIVGATYNDVGITSTETTGAVLVPTNDFYSIITGQLQLKADGTLTNPTVAADGTIDLKQTDYKSYRYVKITLGSATTPATTITPGELSGKFADGNYTVTLPSTSVDITPDVNKGYITAGTAGTVTVESTHLNIPQLKLFTWNGKQLKAGGNGYVITNQLLGTMEDATISKGNNKTIAVTNSLDIMKNDSASAGGVNIYENLLNLTEGTTPGTYTNVTTTEPTEGKFIAFTAKSSGGSTSTKTSVTKAGYAAVGDYDISVTTTGHADLTYYYPVKEATATVSGEKDATTPTINNVAATVSGGTRITNATLTDTTADVNGKYFLAMTATAPATTEIPLRATIGSTGYLGSASQVTGTAKVNAKTSGRKYYAIPKATFGVNGNTISVASAGYIGNGDTVANIDAGSLTYTAGLNAAFVDVDNHTTNNVDVDSLFFTELTAEQKKKDYFTITSTGSGTLTPGYIHDNPTAATAVRYIPKATLEYVTDSEKNKIINVKTAGFLPAGILHDVGEISGTIDTANLEVLVTNPTFNSETGLYDITGSLKVNSSGYVESTANPTKTISLAKATYSGGALSGASTSALSITAGESYTVSTGGKLIKVKANDKSITRAAISVATSGYNEKGASVLAADSATITGGSLDIHIKEGALGANSSSCTITANADTPAVNKGNAKVYASAAAADASNYVKVNATSSSSCSVTTAGWLDTTVSKTGSGSATGYLKASVNPSVTYTSSIDASNLSATTFNVSATSVTIGATNKTVTSSGGVTLPPVGDTYIVGTLGKTAGSQESTTINADCSGSAVDSALESLIKRMQGLAYTAVDAD